MASRVPSFDHGPDQVMHFASLEPVRLGMPELCRAGLSENWLWKACGHRHWLALAAAHGVDRPDFRTSRGERLYPAFVRVALREGALHAAGENDILSFEVRLTRTGNTRFASQITVRARQRRVAAMRMESVFLRRTVAGSNLSAARAIVASPCALLPPVRARCRSARDEPRIALAGNGRVHRQLIDPNPWEDFNGADFLYFSSFQAMIDRAEWNCLADRDRLSTTREREIVYLGNIELGDRVEVCLRLRDDGTGHDAQLHRESDGALIATAVTRRATAAAVLLR
jgi:probable biosynthetic protein (TIGR04099 family)